MTKRKALRIQLIIGYFIPFLLQVWSFFDISWTEEDGVSKGLFYQCQDQQAQLTGDSSNYECSLNLLDQVTIGLEGTSLVLTTFAFLFSVLSVCLYGPDEYDDIDNDEGPFRTFNCLGFYCCSLTLYPVTGVLILSGCIRIGTLFPTETLGMSFYMCAVAGCFHFLVIFISCCDVLCKSKNEEFVFKTFVGRLYEEDF